MRAATIAILAIGWAAFWTYWFVSAFSMKRGRVPWRRELGVRVIIVLVIFLLVRLNVFSHNHVNHNPWVGAVGIIVFAAGLGFAVWARINLGRNWGMPMTERDNPELVTTGPYRTVRHPIYTGLLLGILGSAIALDWLWLVAVVFAGSYCIYAAIFEERYLMKAFPDSYPDYKRSTKMLLPLIL